MTNLEIMTIESADEAAEIEYYAELIADIENINATQLKGLRTAYFEFRVTGRQMVRVRNEEGRRRAA